MSCNEDFEVEFLSHGRKAKCEPNPEFPEGIDLDLRREEHELCCETKLPYPATECGLWVVTCKTCGFRAAITAAGRPDDPRSVKIPCKI